VLVLASSGLEAEVGLSRASLAGSGPVEAGSGEAGSGREGRGALLVRGLGAGAIRGRDLLPCVRDLLAGCALVPRDLAALAVDVGPGSFTGVRLCVTAAKTLAFALGVPVVGVTSLLALAQGAPRQARVLAVRDAGRGTVYAALLGSQPGATADSRPLERAPQRLAATELRHWPADALLVGEEAPRLAAEHALPQRPLTLRADAAAVLALALPRLVAGERTDPATLVPLYLQASAPERLRAGEPAAPGAKRAAPGPVARRPKAG
jgi:tRNA threonylcarbamoyladenosine biosynthesis protein TsaB